MGYVDTGLDGWTELRVHGVSGTAAPVMLEHPNVTRVVGDGAAGFYRRSWESRHCSGDGPEHRVEAYSWGGLTSGNWTRALWLLLLPFMLLNVAFYMTPVSPARDPVPPAKDQGRWGRLRDVNESAQRLLALSLTLTLTLAMVVLGMDLLGWQCGREGADCSAGSWLRVYDWPGMQDPARRLAVSAVIPVGTVTLLWILARRTWAAAERITVTADPRDAGQGGDRVRGALPPLEDRSLWNGAGPVARLRSLHVAAAFAAIGIFLTVPLLPPATLDGAGPLVLLTGPAWTSPAAAFIAAVTDACVAVLVVALVWVTLPSTSRRQAPSEDPADTPVENPQGKLMRVAVGLVALALLIAAGGAWWDGAPTLQRAPTALPWLADVTIIVLVAQVGLLGLIGVLTWIQATLHPAAREAAGAGTAGAGTAEGEDEGEDALPSAIAWRGMGALIFAGAGWALGGAFAAAATVRLADLLGTPSPPGTVTVDIQDDVIVLPVEYFWAAATAFPVLLAVLVAALLAGWQIRRAVKREAAAVIRDYLECGADPSTCTELSPRTRAIAAVRARATVTEQARAAMLLLATLVGVVVTLAIVAAVTDRLRSTDWVISGPMPFLIGAGGVVMGLFVLGLFWVGQRTYADPTFRRTVGILWDLGTFWPRATHPLAPPCYAERAVPDLISRITYLTGNGGRVVLSCHSQGSVIGAATVAAMSNGTGSNGTGANLAFLTYGSPLRRLYSRFFPAYFGPEQLTRLGSVLQAAGTLPTSADHGRGGWPWINLYRPSDPIGGPVFLQRRPFAGAGPASPIHDVDWQLLDPPYHRLAGDTVYPAALCHSGYFLVPAFAAALAAVRERRGPAAAPFPATAASTASTAPATPLVLRLPEDAASPDRDGSPQRGR